METFAVYFLGFVGYFILCGISHIWNCWWEVKRKIIIKLPIRKKYTSGKISPIYKLEQNYFELDHLSDYYVEKWNLQWVFNEYLYILSIILIPFIFIHFQNFKYGCEGSYYYSNKETLLEKETPLDIFWENKHSEEIEKERIKLEHENRFQTKVNELNKIFNENYE